MAVGQLKDLRDSAGLFPNGTCTAYTNPDIPDPGSVSPALLRCPVGRPTPLASTPVTPVGPPVTGVSEVAKSVVRPHFAPFPPTPRIAEELVRSSRSCGQAGRSLGYAFSRPSSEVGSCG